MKERLPPSNPLIINNVQFNLFRAKVEPIGHRRRLSILESRSFQMKAKIKIGQ